MTTSPGAPTVTAVVVAHDGARWLPEALVALAAQTTSPTVVVAADTGSTDASADQLAQHVGPAHLVTLASATGFGAAVDAALELAPQPTDWLWLLHDDSAPDPDCLAALLAAAASDPAIGIVGPKVRAWGEAPLLREVGVTISRSGRRVTGLEAHEYDQGQHDGRHDVLGVSTAGLLIRRELWDRLGGLDRALPLLRDDVDLGWRARLAGARVVCDTDAVVRHAEAVSRGVRPPAAVPHVRRADRRHGAYVLLANLPLARLPLTALSLTGRALLRTVGLFLGKRPRAALDELVALLGLLGRPDRLVRARLARRRVRTVPAREPLSFVAARGTGRRRPGESVAAVLGRRSALRARRATRPDSQTTVVPGTGPTAEEDDELPGWGTGLLRRAFLRPSVGLALGLATLTLVASRGLFGSGRLMGGALLPAPADSGWLWERYVESWHPVALGSEVEAPPYLAVVAALGWLTGGPDRAVSLLLLAAVPLAGLSAYALVRRVVASPLLRVWAALTYALLPPLLAAVRTGRLGTAVVAVLLPLAVLAAGRALNRREAARPLGFAVLLVAVMAAFVSAVLPIAVALALGAALVLRRRLLRLAMLAVAPLVLLLPWLPAFADRPELLLGEPGLPLDGLLDTEWPGLAAVLLHPGETGLPPVWLSAGLLLAAMGAILRTDRRRPVVLAWAVALVALAGAVAVGRLRLDPTIGPEPVVVWPGVALVLAGGALVVAAVTGAEGLRARIATTSFGWRQPAAALTLAVALVGTVGLAGWWAAAGAERPLTREEPGLLPAFVSADAARASKPRTVVLQQHPDGHLSYAVLRRSSPRLGDPELAPVERRPAERALRVVVADLASGRGGDAAARLVPFGIRYLLLAPPADPALARAVDAVPGVVRLGRREGAVVWRLEPRVARARIVPADAPVSDETGSPPRSRVVPAGDEIVDARVPAGDGPRLLVLADPADPGWEASLDGVRLAPTTYDGWAQAFELPNAGGRIHVNHDGGPRTLLLWIQLSALGFIVVLLLPGAPRDEVQP
jgi:GT2 family glycosyltransferase